MAIAWPAFLQDYLNQDSFSHTIGETVISSENDIGPAKTRRRFTKSVDSLQCTIDIPKSDYSNFYNFYDVTLNAGINYFNFVHPFTGVTEEFRISKPPRIALLGANHLRISMDWEMKP